MAQVQPSAGGPPWSAELRAWVSLALFAHLFAIFVAVTTYTRPSETQSQLHRLFAAYLRNLHLSPYLVSYPLARFDLTLGSPSDAEFTCDVEVEGGDDAGDEISIPQQKMWPLVRYRRYQALATAAGSLAVEEASDDLSGVLPGAIAGSVLKRHDATQGVVRIRAHAPPELEQMSQGASARPPSGSTRDVYEAQVFLSESGVEVLKKSATLEVSPVENSNRPRARRP
jgi:hypothetical protein